MTALVIGYLAWLAWVVRRLVHDPLPRSSDVVHLSLFFYNVPLSVVAAFGGSEAFGEYTVFLSSVAGDAAIAERTLLLTFLASLAVEAGRAATWALRGRIRAPRRLAPTPKLQSVTSGLAFATLPVIALGIVLFGIESFFAGYAVESTSESASSGTALVFFSYEVIGLCAFLWLSVYLLGGHRRGAVLIGVGLICVLLLTVMRGKRLELIIALLPLFLLLWSTRLKRPVLRLAAVAALIVVASAAASLRFGELPTPASLAFNALSEGFYAGHVTPGIIEALDQGWISYEYGLRVLAGFAAFVPRFVFPAKDELLYQSLTELLQFAPLGASSSLAEAYLQGGAVAVALWFFLVGWLARIVQVPSLVEPGRGISVRAVWYVLFVCSFVPHFRDGLIPSIKIPLQLLLAFGAIMLIVGVSSRRVSSKGNQPRKRGNASEAVSSEAGL